jgi:hypothetical protein
MYKIVNKSSQLLVWNDSYLFYHIIILSHVLLSWYTFLSSTLTNTYISL